MAITVVSVFVLSLFVGYPFTSSFFGNFAAPVVLQSMTELENGKWARKMRTSAHVAVGKDVSKVTPAGDVACLHVRRK